MTLTDSSVPHLYRTTPGQPDKVRGLLSEAYGVGVNSVDDGDGVCDRFSIPMSHLDIQGGPKKLYIFHHTVSLEPFKIK